MNNIVAIIQARMGSNRFPGKTLKEICGQPMLGWVTRRTAKARLLNRIVVATTNESSDDLIEDYCKEMHIDCFRGSSEDVLDRFYQTAIKHRADAVVRITADCPFIDPELIDEVIIAFQRERVDFAANRLPPPFERTYPIGLDVEVVSFSSLECAWQEANLLHEREHVMPYFYEVPGRFRIYILNHTEDLGFHRWTVDTPKDLEFISKVAQKLGCRLDFTWLQVLKILQDEPELLKINAQVQHKKYTDTDQRVNHSSYKK